jgi:hypothetical protein
MMAQACLNGGQTDCAKNYWHLSIRATSVRDQMTLASARATLDDKMPAWLSSSRHDIETSLSRKRPDLGYRALLASYQHHLDR